MRNAAPATFTTVKATDDVATKAERPIAAAAACTRMPAQTPIAAMRAADRPVESACVVTSTMSGPGVITTTNATPMNATTSESMVITPEPTVGEEGDVMRCGKSA